MLSQKVSAVEEWEADISTQIVTFSPGNILFRREKWQLAE